MLRNYLMIAFRNFQRQKFFALLNMFGLGMGLASAILIFLYVNDELQYDSMHPYPKTTWRIGSRFSNTDGRSNDNTVAPGIWLKRLKESRTEIEKAVRIDYIGYPTSLHHKESDKIILTESIKWAEPGFEEVLSFNLLKGNPSNFFEEHNSIVLSETGARKLFPNSDPMGEIISVKHNWATNGREIDVMITGIYKDYPANSSFKPQYILNVNALRAVQEDFNAYMEGSNFQQNIEFFESYFVMKEGADRAAVENALNNFADEMTQSDSSLRANGWKLSAFIENLSDLHFDEKNLWENTNKRGDKTYLAIFSGVAVMILVIACINYMNLATARAGRRAREVGLRKSLGSKRSEVAKQFFYESSLMCLSSLVIAIMLVIIFMQPFNELSDKSFSISSLLNLNIIVITVAIVVIMAFISGSYPAIYLSAFKPIEVLKGQIVKGKGAEFFRKTLVTMQYVVALVLIISTFIIIGQMDLMKNTKLNERGSQLLSIRYGGNAPQDKYQAFKESVLADRDIQYVTMANHLPRLNYFGWIGATVKFPEFSNNEFQWNQLNVDFDFAKTYDLEIIAGRDFDANNVSNSSTFILNEAAVKALGKSVEEVIGSSVTLTMYNGRGPELRTFKVIGIVRDFPFRSMHQVIEPLILNPRVHFIDRIAYVRLPAGKFQEKIQFIENKWKQIFPGVGFDYWFVSDEFNRMYENETRISSLAKTFATLAIVITALGVFGLASYTAEQRTKEVGIRKVMGASIAKIVRMFLWTFVKIFFVSCVIAIPAAYFLASNWLKNFVYRSPVSPEIFIGSALGLLIVTILTVSYETWKAARMNPVNSLRAD
jgi:putative ABC transport system permease protein